MCVVSMVADHYMDKWNRRVNTPDWSIAPYPTIDIYEAFPGGKWLPVSRAEYDALKAELEEMKALLARAKAYDERTGQAECETAEKLKVLFAVADALGVNLDEVIDRPE